MYENQSYADILKTMLGRVSDDYDKREGGVLYNALAPAAVELQLMALELNRLRAEIPASTCSHAQLVDRCRERGIVPGEAQKALRKGLFNLDVPIGSRYSLGSCNYKVVERLDKGTFVLECETPGEAGNKGSGRLLPIQYIPGLQTATLGEILVPGENAETTEALRKRYFAGFDSQAFGGNRADYKEKVKALDGIGGVKVERAWNGGGTVRLTIIASDFSAPSPLLVDKVQQAVDPLGNAGEGMGLAPIDHLVTVVGVAYQAVDIQADFTFQEGWDLAASLPYLEQAADAYFRELSSTWESMEELIVRISQLETRLLNAEGILDIGGTQINGMAQNLVIPGHLIPKRGELSHAPDS